MFATEHMFPHNADGTPQESLYFGSHPRSPTVPRARGCGASGPASGPSASAAGGRHRRRLCSRRAVRRGGRVGGRLGLGRRVVIVIAVPAAAATPGLETVGDHTEQGRAGARQGLMQAFGDIATITPDTTHDHHTVNLLEQRERVGAGGLGGYLPLGELGGRGATEPPRFSRLKIVCGNLGTEPGGGTLLGLAGLASSDAITAPAASRVAPRPRTSATCRSWSASAVTHNS